MIYTVDEIDEIKKQALKEGARRERRALRRWLPKHWLTDDYIKITTVLDWLAARAKGKHQRTKSNL